MEASFRLGEAVIHYYTLFIALAVILSAGWLIVRTPKPQRLAMTDTLLIALVAGLIAGRVVHVALNWAHFGFHTNEILNWQAGGLDWHGVLFGGLIGIWLGSRWRDFDLMTLIDRLTPAIPLIALAGWLGCWNFACHYGREVQRLVDYPAFMVWEAEDVFGIFAPRFHTQLLGTSLSIALLILVLLLFWRGWGRNVRFWWVLMLLSLGMFGIGFLRGDYALMLAGLRSDQWLDVVTMVVSGVILVGIQRRPRVDIPPSVKIVNTQ